MASATPPLPTTSRGSEFDDVGLASEGLRVINIPGTLKMHSNRTDLRETFNIQSISIPQSSAGARIRRLLWNSDSVVKFANLKMVKLPSNHKTRHSTFRPIQHLDPFNASSVFLKRNYISQHTLLSTTALPDHTSPPNKTITLWHVLLHTSYLSIYPRIIC